MSDTDTYIIRCKSCGAANRVPADQVGKTAKCGKCHQMLATDKSDAAPEARYKMRCIECGAKNRIPAGKLKAGPKCGKCGSTLKTEELFVPQPMMVNDANFDSQILKSPLPVLIWAWAPW